MNDRLQSLDIFRGLTIAFMIIVNTPGSWSVSYWPLQHAKWHGFTPTDLVFPSFVFITGVSAWFAFKKDNHVLTSNILAKIGRRTLILFLLGVMLYAFPFYDRPLSTWRVLGVLQRIALCYGIGSIICLKLDRKKIIALSIALLFGYWFILCHFGDFSLENNAVCHLDRWLFGDSHLYHGDGIAFDPEGFLSTMPALVTFMIGYLVGQFIGTHDDKQLIMKRLVITAAALMLMGVLWDIYFPINKKLWTSSYVLLAAGLSMSIFTIIYYVSDILKFRKWASGLIVFGTNAILAYLISEYLITIMERFLTFSQEAGKPLSAHEGTYKVFFANVFGANELSSFLWALAYTGICWLAVYPFFKAKIFLKV